MDSKKYKILVIEDNPGDFVIIEEFLAETLQAPNIINAVNFNQASKILLDENNAFDIILLDLSLPDKEGKRLIDEILMISRGTPIIILTGYSDMNFAIQAISYGIEDYLLKDDLSAAILYKSITYSIERQRSKSELLESEKRYSNLFHLSPQPMWVYDIDTFQFVQVNKAAIKCYGYSEEEFLQMSILDIRPKFDLEKLLESIGQRKEKVFGLNSGRFRHIKKSGEIMEVEVFSAPIKIDNREFRSVIAYDVTEKIQYEELMTKAIIKTQEDERYEIGSELHDNICQTLAVTQMSIDKLKDSLSSETLPWYQNARKTLLLALEEIRNLSHRLAPAFYDNITLEESVRKLIRTFDVNKKYIILVSFDNLLENRKISNELQLNLYRILQEQLRNIEKYASATEIKIILLLRNENLYLTTVDNGIGFVMNNGVAGIGFANMRRRVELFNGEIEIDSSPGKGCKILISIPINQAG
jgi:PAS domain S-box-containing protein